MAGIIFYNHEPSEALSYAAEILKTNQDCLNDSPDFLVLEPDIDSVRDVLLNLSAVSDGMRVVYFPEADKGSIIIMNTLLKTLEDRDEVEFIFLAKKPLLATIESRCVIKHSKMLSREDFKEYLMKEIERRDVYIVGEEDTNLLYTFCKNKDTLDSLLSEMELIVLLKEFTQSYGKCNREYILNLFSNLREKDSNNFFEKYKYWVPHLYEYFVSVIQERILQEDNKKPFILALDAVLEHIRLLNRSNSYSKNDFFDLLCRL